MRYIIKRNGDRNIFEPVKIELAIKKAFLGLGYEESYVNPICKSISLNVTNNLHFDSNDTIGIEQVQDEVEQQLMINFPNVAKAYILYREERRKTRDMMGRLMNAYEGITSLDNKDVDMIRENANIDGVTPMGSMLKFGSESAKEYYLLKMLNPDHAKAHRDGWIHIHDLDFYSFTTTCCQIDLTKLFKGGFTTGHGHLREPQSIGSYAALAAIAIQSNQNDQHGGQSIPSFDRDMAPGVKKTFIKNFKKNLINTYEDIMGVDDGKEFINEALSKVTNLTNEHPMLENGIGWDATLAYKLVDDENIDKGYKIIEIARKRAIKDTDRDTYQAMEGFIHNLNTMHSRAGGQVPFSSINYGTDTSPEGRMVIKNLLLTTMKGLGNGETPIFPIQIFKMKKGINCEDGEPNYDLYRLALLCTSKRMFPNFSFIDAPFNLQYYDPERPETEIAYMGCRTRVIGNYYDKSREQVNSRGNLSFTSINLPRLGIEANGDLSKFFSMLDDLMNLVSDQLLERLEVQSRRKVYNFPFMMGNGVWLDSEKLGWEDEVREVLKHGTLSIGFIGLAECLKALIGKHHGESEEAQELGLSIIKHMREFVDRKTIETGLNFTLLGTP